MADVCTFTVDTGSGLPVALTMNTPHTISYVDSRNIVRFYFWTGTSYTGDIEKSAETVTMNGNMTSATNLQTIDTQVDAGESLVLAGLADALLNREWVVRNFTYTRASVNEYQWSLTLEKK